MNTSEVYNGVGQEEYMWRCTITIHYYETLIKSMLQEYSKNLKTSKKKKNQFFN